MNTSTPIQKVMAYITRHQADKLQLLVFRHRDFPEAGLQVPAGTVAKAKRRKPRCYAKLKRSPDFFA